MIDMLSPERLAADLADAVAAAWAAAMGTPDTGSMSADHVHIPVGSGRPIRFRTKAFDSAAGSSSHYRSSGFWKGYLVVPPGHGVASARLASAEAMARVLADRGWGATVYYQRD